MNRYIGTKLIAARPMTLLDYNNYRSWDLPEDENGSDEGYLVEYLDGGKSNHPDHDGYISWSPKAQFENAYREIDGLSFGFAIEALRAGMRVARRGWNGKRMWLVLAKGSNGNTIEMRPGSDYFKAGLSAVKIDAHIDMMTAQGTMQPGWLASQADMLADDWQIVLD